MEDDSLGIWDLALSSLPENITISEENTSVPSLWFTCSGEVSNKDTRLNSNSYILNGELKIINDYEIIWKQLKNPVTLFDKSFDQDCALLVDCKLLFHLALKNLMILDSATRLNYRITANVSSLSSENDEYKQIRKQLCELLSFIRCYIGTILSQKNNARLREQIIPIIFDSLSALRRFLRSLKDLPSYVVTYSASSLGNECQLASYHLFHVHLDLRWYCLTTLHQITKCHVVIQDDAQENVVNILEDQILCFLSDLFLIAIDRFEKIPINSILKKSPFTCTCVKELWLMLQFYVNKLYEDENGKTFWTHVNHLLEIVLNKRTPIRSSVLNSFISFKCSDPLSFSTWLLVHIVQLNGYTEDGKFVGIASGRIESNYSQLEDILKICTVADTNVSEAQLRVIITLVTTLMTEWWEVRSEPVMLLWEYYHRRLNCAFYVQGATPDTMAVMSKTGAGLLEQVKSCLHDHVQEDANSFNLFLRLLGKHLRRCTEQNHHNHWQKMKGRIYSKLSPSKMQNLTEMGLYHLVSLFLTLAITGNLQEIGSKLQDMLNLLPPQSIDVRLLHVNIKANIALLLLYVERGIDITEVSQQLQIIVTDLCSQKTSNSRLLMRTYVDGIQDVIRASNPLHLSEHCLIGSWIMQYLSNSTFSDSCHLLDCIITIITTIRQAFSNFMDEELVHNRKMAEVLYQHVLPYIQKEYKNISGQPPIQVVDIAAGLTILALEQPGIQGHTFKNLFTYFVNQEKVNLKFLMCYLCRIMSEEVVIQLVTDGDLEIENNVMQTWVRCSILSVNETVDDLGNLTRTVNRLPAMHNLYQLTGICPVDTNDAIFTFIKMLGAIYRNMQDINRKSAFRDKSTVYLLHVEKCVQSVANSTTSSNELISKIYLCAACMVYHCSQLIYVKSNSNCLLPRLVQLLLLPHAVYKPEIQLKPQVAAALKKTLHQFVFGIFKLNPKSDEFVARVLRDIFVQYMTRLVNKSATTPGVFINHPLLKCCTEYEDTELCKFALETLSNKYMTCKGNIPQDYAKLVFLFITDVISVKKHSELILRHIIEVSLLNMLEFVMLVESTHIANKLAVEIIKSVLKNNLFNDENTKLREMFISVIQTLCQKHIAFSSGRLFKVCIFVGELSRDIMLNCISQLKELVASVEHRRGVGYDPGLRNGLAKVMSSLGAQ